MHLRGVWRKIPNAPSFTSTVDLMMELCIIPLDIQHQNQLFRFIARLQFKPKTKPDRNNYIEFVNITRPNMLH